MSAPVEVRLSLTEANAAAMIGVLRNLRSVFDDRKDKLNIGKGYFQAHIEGALGEMAVAKALNIHNPLTVNTFKDADLGVCLQVRTRSEHWHDLIVRENDSSDEIYILCTGSCPEFKVHGWVYGSEAMRDEYLKNHGEYGDAWFVPADKLRPLNTIPKEML